MTFSCDLEQRRSERAQTGQQTPWAEETQSQGRASWPRGSRKSWSRKWGHVRAGVQPAWGGPHLLLLQELLAGRDSLPGFPQLSSVVMNGRAGAVNTMRTKALASSHVLEDTVLRAGMHRLVL